MEQITITCGTVKHGDKITFAGWGYDRKGREINDGKFVSTDRRTKAKIVQLKQFVAEVNYHAD
jgi:hypothetical protein